MIVTAINFMLLADIFYKFKPVVSKADSPKSYRF